MRRRSQRRPSNRDGTTAATLITALPKPWNKTTACLCCLVIVLAAIQAFIGFQVRQFQEEVEQQLEEQEFIRQATNGTLHYNETTNSIHKHGIILPSHSLPRWIQDYLHWHQSQRAQYPGRALFDHPDAPKLLIRTCLGLCGGLNDRLGQLPWDLYLANQTGRLLLLHWHRPVMLEEFLVPSELDWRVSKDVPGFFGTPRVSRQDMQLVRNIKELFQGYEQESGPEALFWESQFDAAMERATLGEFKDVKVLRHRLLGHLDEDQLERRLVALGEADLLHGSPSFGNIFRMFFQLNPNVQRELDGVYSSLKLRPTLGPTDNYSDAERFAGFSFYSGVHCRVRHPKATPQNVLVKGKNADYPADKTGLPWEGETRDFAIETATHALACAKTLIGPNLQAEPVYFFADSNDLVRFMSHELNEPLFLQANMSLLSTPVATRARQVVESMRIVSRDTAWTQENAHIDRQKGRDAPSYYATFLDLYLAIYARCVTYGIGYYAALATRISGTQCKQLYQEETWGGRTQKRQNAPTCPLIAEHVVGRIVTQVRDMVSLSKLR